MTRSAKADSLSRLLDSVSEELRTTDASLTPGLIASIDRLGDALAALRARTPEEVR